MVAMDIAPTAIEACRQRWPNSTVAYQTANIIAPPTEWVEKFDLVVEIHILQAIPESIRDTAANQLPTLLSTGGTLLCIGRWAGFQTPIESPPPWPLSRTWLEGRFTPLKPTSFQRFSFEETPSIDRYHASWCNESNPLT